MQFSFVFVKILLSIGRWVLWCLVQESTMARSTLVTYTKCIQTAWHCCSLFVFSYHRQIRLFRVHSLGGDIIFLRNYGFRAVYAWWNFSRRLRPVSEIAIGVESSLTAVTFTLVFWSLAVRITVRTSIAIWSGDPASGEWRFFLQSVSQPPRPYSVRFAAPFLAREARIQK